MSPRPLPNREGVLLKAPFQSRGGAQHAPDRRKAIAIRAGWRRDNNGEGSADLETYAPLTATPWSTVGTDVLLWPDRGLQVLNDRIPQLVRTGIPRLEAGRRAFAEVRAQRRRGKGNQDGVTVMA